MPKEVKRKYSPMEKNIFHEKRLRSDSVSENKRIYSKNWIEGFLDPHYRTNLSACNDEIKERRRNKVKVNSYDIGLYGYRNGLRTRKQVSDRK